LEGLEKKDTKKANTVEAEDEFPQLGVRPNELNVRDSWAPNQQGDNAR